MMFARDVFRKLWGDLFATPQLSETIDFVSLTLIGNPTRTMADIPNLLAGGPAGIAFREPLIQQASRILPPPTAALVKTFWSQYSRTYGESMLNRVSTFLASPVGYTIVSQPHSTVNWRQAMDHGSIIYVRLESSLSDLNILIGSAMIGQILTAALSRSDIPEAQRKPFYLIAEEYENYQTMAFSEIIDQCRKYRIIPVISHQRFGQLRRTND
jgi:hypothetical protein